MSDDDPKLMSVLWWGHKEGVGQLKDADAHNLHQPLKDNP